MNRRLRTAFAVTAAIGAGLLMTACGGSDKPSASAGATTTAAAVPLNSSAPSGRTDPTASSGDQGSGTSGASTGNGSSGTTKSSSAGASGSAKGTSGTGGGDADAGKSGYGQVCGTNDISWSASLKSQAGGYYLISGKAMPGITCVLPAALPVIAFGSDGTEAGPAEQSVGQAITLRAGVTVYAGVNPKTTVQDGGKELADIIVSVSDDDPNPVSLHVGSYTVDKPIVTDWHTSAADAVPFSS